MTEAHKCQPEITDAMCEAALKTNMIDRIQGFSYNTRHVIRDVWKPWNEQQIWEINKNDADAALKFYHRCEIETIRLVLQAALAASPEVKP